MYNKKSIVGMFKNQNIKDFLNISTNSTIKFSVSNLRSSFQSTDQDFVSTFKMESETEHLVLKY